MHTQTYVIHRVVRLQDHCKGLIEEYGSVRATAKFLKIDAGYLHRMAQGKAFNPSPAIVKKLGLDVTKTTTYHLPHKRK